MTESAAVARGLVPRHGPTVPTDDRPQLIHTLDHHIDLLYGNTRLFRYVYRPDTPPLESPKPYFHPVRTLAGNNVTVFRAHDQLDTHHAAYT